MYTKHMKCFHIVVSYKATLISFEMKKYITINNKIILQLMFPILGSYLVLLF